MNRLDIILRTCLKSNLDKNLDENKVKRVCGPDRELMLTKCLTSLIVAINNTDFPIKLTVLDDESSKDFLDKIKLMLMKCKYPHKLISLSKTGFNNSAYKQFSMCAKSDDLVYSVEDDYLHEPTAITNMLNAYNHFTKINNAPALLFPMDELFRYEEHKLNKIKLYFDGTRYWRTVNQTTNTIFTHSSVIKNNFEVFKTLALKYPKVLEDDTINRLYYSEDTDQGIIHAYNPIPSVAYNLSYTPHPSIKTSHASWDHIWTQTKLWNLIDGWFNYEQFYTNIVANLSHNANIVEVGAWMGKSTACLASLCKASAKNIMLYVVDTWQGSDEEVHKQLIAKLAKNNTSLRRQFDLNMEMCGVTHDMVPLQMSSVEASKMFEDNTLDFVMIDASHDYINVKQDIEHWLPKIKKGGILAGDDYDPNWHGVVDAVNEKFSKDFQILGTTWFKIV